MRIGRTAPDSLLAALCAVLALLAFHGVVVCEESAAEAGLGTVVSEGPVDAGEYVVGPGDQLLIAILGKTQQIQTVPVSPEGYVLVPPTGGIDVGGKSLADAKTIIRRTLGRYYHDVEIRVVLAELRRFEVHVYGAIENPGTYVVNALTRVSTVIQLAGGLAEGGSRRSIRLLSTAGETRIADLVRFDVLGERKWNPFVADGDLVQVPVVTRRVVVHGRVGLPGTYEFVEGESLADLIRISGGFLDDAIRENVEVRRFLEDEPSRTRMFEVDFTTDPPVSEETDLTVHPEDEVYVRGVPKWHLHRGVTIEGEVYYPGDYVIEEGKDHLLDLIERAGGFTDDADLVSATLTRRGFGDEAIDREFKRLQTIPVADMTDDEYAYFKMRSRENKDRVVTDFRSLYKDESGEENILLRRGDLIEIPRQTKTITVSGQAVNPGKIPFEEDRDYQYYIERAGGFARRANKGKIRIIKAVTGQWFDRDETPLEPGDTVWIPEKSQHDYWALFKDFMTISAQVATVVIVINNAGR